MRRLLGLSLLVLACAPGSPGAASEPIIGGPCGGCENVFVGMPEAFESRSRIAPPDEPGEPLVIEGTVRGPEGEPRANVIVYAYHTDATGIYPRASTQHGRLRGWARTDLDGHYRFETIRPAAYPDRTEPQHVHMHVLEPGRATYFIDSIHFDDDPLLTPAVRRRLQNRGGNGIVHPEREADGAWQVRRDIVLGRGVPNYPCERRWTSPVPFYQSLSWSPDGSKMAFSAVTTSWEEGYRIFIANVDGSGLTPLDTGDVRSLYPVWSPDGSRIAFASERDGNSDIYVIGADGTGLRRLTDHEANDSYPTWSPDGSRIAFHSKREGNYEIFVMNADGSAVTAITDHPGDDYNPAWSPDGSLIAFDADRDDTPGDEIYVAAPDGSGLRRVVDAGVFPTWSPDGRKILFTWEGLHVVDANGAGKRRLLPASVYAAWSPDGATIAATATEFDENCKDRHSLITLDPDGTRRATLLP